MSPGVVKNAFYGAVREIIVNDKYFYESSTGIRYSHLTDEGEAALAEVAKLFAAYIRFAEKDLIDQRAKEMAWQALKQEN